MARGLKPATRRLQLLQTLFKKYRLYQQVEGCELADLLVYTLVVVQCAKKYLREDLLGLPEAYDAIDDAGSDVGTNIAATIAEKLGIQIKSDMSHNRDGPVTKDLVTDGDKIVEAVIIGLLGEIYYAQIKTRDETYVDEKGNVYHFPNLVEEAQQHWKVLLKAEIDRIDYHKFQSEEALERLESKVEAIRQEMSVEETVARMEHRQADVEEFKDRIADEEDLSITIRKQLETDTTLYDLISKELDAVLAEEALAAGAAGGDGGVISSASREEGGLGEPITDADTTAATNNETTSSVPAPNGSGNHIPNDHLRFCRYLPFSIVGEESFVPLPTRANGDKYNTTNAVLEETFEELEAKALFQGRVQTAIDKCRNVYLPMMMPCTYTRLFGPPAKGMEAAGRITKESLVDPIGIAKYEKDNIDALSKEMLATRGCTYQYVDEIEKITTDDHERLRQQRKIMRLRAVVSKMQSRWYEGRKDLMRDLRRLKFISAGVQQHEADRGNNDEIPEEDTKKTPSQSDIFSLIPHLDDLIKRVTLATTVAQEVLMGTAHADTLKKHSYVRHSASTTPAFTKMISTTGLDDLFDDTNAENAVCLALYDEAGTTSTLTDATPPLTAARLAELQRKEFARQYNTGEFEDEAEEAKVDNMSLSRASDVMTAPRSPTSAGIGHHRVCSVSEHAATHNTLLVKTANLIAPTPRGQSMPSARGTGRLNSARRAQSATSDPHQPLHSARRLQSVASITFNSDNGDQRINTARKTADGNESESVAAGHLVSESVFSVDGGFAATSLSAAALTLSHNTNSLLDDRHKSCRPKSVTEAALSTMVAANPLCVFPFQESSLLKASLLQPQRTVKATPQGAGGQDAAHLSLSKSKYRGDGNILDLYAGVVRDIRSQQVLASGKLNAYVMEGGGDLSGLISDSDDEIEVNRRYRKKHPLKARPIRNRSAAAMVSADKQSVAKRGSVGSGLLNGGRRPSTQPPTQPREKPSITFANPDKGSVNKHNGRRASSFGIIDGDRRRSSTAQVFADDSSENGGANLSPEARQACRLQRKKEDAMLVHYYRHQQRLLLRHRVGLLIDPIDATNAFVNGDPRAPMCLVGIAVDGAPVAGIANRVFLHDDASESQKLSSFTKNNDNKANSSTAADTTPASPAPGAPSPPPKKPKNSINNNNTEPFGSSDSKATAAQASSSSTRRKSVVGFAVGPEEGISTSPSPQRLHLPKPVRPPPKDGVSLPMRLLDQTDDAEATDEDRRQSGKHGTCLTVHVNPAGILHNPNGALSYSLHYLDGSFINFLVLNGNLIYADEAALIDGKYQSALNLLREREINRRHSVSSTSPAHRSSSTHLGSASSPSAGVTVSGGVDDNSAGVSIPSLNLRKAAKDKAEQERDNFVSDEEDKEYAETIKGLFDVFGNAADATMISDGFSELGQNIRREIRRLALKFEKQGIVFNDTAWGSTYDMLILEKLLLHVVHSNSIKTNILRSMTKTIEPFEGSTAAGAGNKVLMVAEGDVDGFFATQDSLKKWDTCAPHAFLRCLGGDVVDMDGESLFYPTPEYAQIAIERAREQAAFSSLVLLAGEPAGVEGGLTKPAPQSRPTVQVKVKQAEKRAEFAAFEAFTTAADAEDDDIEFEEDTGVVALPPVSTKPSARFTDSVLLTDSTKHTSHTNNNNEPNNNNGDEDSPALLSSLRRRRHSAVGGQTEGDATTYYDPISLPKGAIALRGHFVKSVILRRLGAKDVENDDWDIDGRAGHVSTTYDSAGQMLTARGQGRHHTVRARVDVGKLQMLEDELAREKKAEEEAAARYRAQQNKCCCTVS